MMRIAHIINSLEIGGAEMMLYKLLQHSDGELFQVEVFSLVSGGAIADKIAALGIPVHSLALDKHRASPLKGLQLSILLRRGRFDAVQTWLHHSDLVGGVSAKAAGIRNVFWNIRESTLEPGHVPLRTRRIARLCARVSRIIPTRIVCCSTASFRAHADLGYVESKMLVIPNGFDTKAFVPDTNAGVGLRSELGIESGPLVGLIGRFHPRKNHKMFFEAAGLIRKQIPSVHFVLCGKGLDADNSTLRSWIREYGPDGSVHLLGSRSDMPRITAALDLATSTSSSEGFPNAIGEAMSCGVPCVVTNVGDSAFLVGNTGFVVPSADPERFASACVQLLQTEPESRRRLGAAARSRIETEFDISAIAEKYAQLYQQTVQ
jgi:glycosyltransferase involved in cell wall biosynthesis